MPPSAAVIARDQRILAGYRAGASLLDLAIAEEVDPAFVRRVLSCRNRPTCFALVTLDGFSTRDSVL